MSSKQSQDFRKRLYEIFERNEKEAANLRRHSSLATLDLSMSRQLTVTDSTQMPGERIVKASLERLSPEILIQILLEVSSSQSLYSLIRASPKCYQVFLISKAKILTGLVRQTIHPAAIMDALTAVKAMQLKDSRPDRKQVRILRLIAASQAPLRK